MLMGDGARFWEATARSSVSRPVVKAVLALAQIFAYGFAWNIDHEVEHLHDEALALVQQLNA